jgi:hypothetical protein
MDPTCPPASVAIDVGAPDPTESTSDTAVASVEQTPQEEVQMEDVAEQEIEEAQQALETAEASLEADAEAAAEEAAVEEAVEDDTVEELVSEQDLEDIDDERLSPEELAALAAQGPEDDKETLASETLASLEGAENALESQDASGAEQEANATALEESAQQSAFFEEAEQASQASAFEGNAQSVQGFAGFQMRVDFGSSASVAGGSGVGLGSSPLDAAISVGSPVSMANTFEILNSVGGQSNAAPAAATASSEKSENEMSEGQSETINEMGAVPGFAAYTQTSLQDRADFYAIRDIYSRRRLQDANFELYRLMQTNDARWQEMVDEQYR